MSRLADRLRRAAYELRANSELALLLNQAAEEIEQPPIGYITPAELNQLRCGRDALISPTRRTEAFKPVWTQKR